jgi:hypothetical protein
MVAVQEQLVIDIPEVVEPSRKLAELWSVSLCNASTSNPADVVSVASEHKVKFLEEPWLAECTPATKSGPVASKQEDSTVGYYPVEEPWLVESMPVDKSEACLIPIGKTCNSLSLLCLWWFLILSIMEGSGSMVIHYAGHVCMEP